MRIKELKLKNIGPFSEAALDFMGEVDGTITYPIVVLTGENGSGKSIVIDAIRALLMGTWGIGRDIVADVSDFSLEMVVVDGENENKLTSTELTNGDKGLSVRTPVRYAPVFNRPAEEATKVDWIIDFWDSRVDTSKFTISNLASLAPQNALVGALNGMKKNVELTNFICSIDYLRSSEKKEEREIGTAVYHLLKKAIDACLDDGEFKYISRVGFVPMVEVKGKELSLEKLSSGNLLLVEHFVELISRLYGICALNGRPIKEITKIEGVLLIDEIENHLHPKWQKKIVSVIRNLFPNLQLILTTHSPFVVSSVKDAKIFVCESSDNGSCVYDRTDDYSSLPVDEVLATDVFSVGPFNSKITAMMKERKNAIAGGDQVQERKLADELYQLNREYFSFLKTKDKIEALLK